MERSAAIKKLSKMLGKGFGYRVNHKAPTPDQREAAQAELPAARTEHNKLKEALNERYKAILGADAEYQRLFAATRAARERIDKLVSTCLHYKFAAGTSAAGGMFFHIRAEGDSWEQVIAKLEAKVPKAAPAQSDVRGGSE